MKKSEGNNSDEVRMKLMGMGKNSIRKNYYRELLERQQLLEMRNKQLEEEIRERVKIEDELKELNEELEKRVMERTRALENMQGKLRRSERISSLGALIIGISHELNTPLGNGMMTSTYLTQLVERLIIGYETGEIDQSQAIKELSKVNDLTLMLTENFKRSTDLINHFKRVSTEEILDEIKDINVHKCINEALDNMRRDLLNQNISVLVDCDEDIVIYSYPNLLNQIIVNLISNSLKHAFATDGEISIRFKRESKSESNILTYHDNGRGMDKDTLTRVFDPFFTSDLGKGSGLGLYIIHNLVNNDFQGIIEITSILKEGTTVSIRFPNISNPNI